MIQSPEPDEDVTTTELLAESLGVDQLSKLGTRGCHETWNLFSRSPVRGPNHPWRHDCPVPVHGRHTDRPAGQAEGEAD